MPIEDSLFMWIAAVEMPVVGALFWLIWRNRRDADQQLAETRQRAEIGLSQAREALAAHKLDVARTYASMATLKDVEARLTAHLLRIETKLDETRARAAE